MFSVSRRLNSGNTDLDEAPRAADSGRRDLDVGPIRIVDADVERERIRRNRKRGDDRIKVRYFE